MKFLFDRVSASQACVALVVYSLVLHLGMFAYGLSRPDVWLNWDRANQRFASLQAVLDQRGDLDALTNLLLSQGLAGDYAIHALVYAFGGQAGVILFQILLLTLSVAALFRISLAITGKVSFAILVSLLYLHFPHSLAYPHFLASEAVYIPALILSFYFLFQSTYSDNYLLSLSAAGLLLGLASLVRPVTIPFGVCALIIAALTHRGRPGGGWTAFALASLVPVVLWVGFQYSGTGNLTLGKSSYDMPHNLSNRIKRISRSLAPREREAVELQYLRKINSDGEVVERKVLSIGEYLQFAAVYPGPFFRHLGRDTAVFVGKTGSTRLTFDYLELYPETKIAEIQRTWRSNWESQGFIGATLNLLKNEPFLIFSSFFLSLVCLVIFTFAMSFGAYAFWNDAKRRDAQYLTVAILLIIFPIYVFATSQVVDAIQSRHRAPAEFAIAILFCFGAFKAAAWRVRRRPIDLPAK